MSKSSCAGTTGTHQDLNIVHKKICCSWIKQVKTWQTNRGQVPLTRPGVTGHTESTQRKDNGVLTGKIPYHGQEISLLQRNAAFLPKRWSWVCLTIFALKTALLKRLRGYYIVNLFPVGQAASVDSRESELCPNFRHFHEFCLRPFTANWNFGCCL